MDRTILSTSTGLLRGVVRHSSDGLSFLSFRGIPYAEAPVGERRFRPPQPKEPWQGTWEALKCGPECPQYNPLTREVVGHEDNCLTLNVYSRANGQAAVDPLLPIMIWIHGGAFLVGSGSDFFYGPRRAMNQNIVLVTINYRLGPFGFARGTDKEGQERLTHNLGFLDQRLAVEWVKRNAGVFGGDPNNITVFGESAGAASAHYLGLSDPHQQLVRRVILQSGNLFCPWALSAVEDVGVNLVERLCQVLSCNSLDELRLVEARHLVKASLKINEEGGGLGAGMAAVAKVRHLAGLHNLFFLPVMAEAEADINLELKLPCLIGITAEEGATLSALLLSHSSLKKKLRKSDGKLLSALLLWSPTKTSRRTRMPKKDDAASASAVAKVRAHYSLEQEQPKEGSIRRRSWDDEEVERKEDEVAEDRLTRAISDALFVYPFYRMLKTAAAAGDSTPNRVFAYKYSHRGEVSLTQIINRNVQKKASSHFDEVLIQFENKLFGQHHQLNEVDERMARFLWSTWAKFAASDKGGEATPGWPQYTHQGGDYYLELRLPTPSSSASSRDNRLFQPADMLFWDRLVRHRPRCSAAL